MFPLLVLVALFISAIPNSNICPEPSPQDIGGAAAQIFGRPEDPDVHRQAPSSGGVVRSERTAGRAKPGSNEPSDVVEDALELANSSRNSNPPRYHDAEVGYRLAAKLSPKDPRPLIGLGNIWYDQKQYAAAAKMYREAMAMMATSTTRVVSGLRGEVSSPQQRRDAARLHAFLGATLLQTENFLEAQVEFEKAIRSNASNAQWHALRGCSLVKQGKIGEAKKAFQEAVRLDPANAEYQKLLESIRE